jgi:hypothetical protein
MMSSITFPHLDFYYTASNIYRHCHIGAPFMTFFVAQYTPMHTIRHPDLSTGFEIFSLADHWQAVKTSTCMSVLQQY